MKQFTISGLHIENRGGWSYLVCNFDVEGMESPFREKTMWFSVKDENKELLSD